MPANVLLVVFDTARADAIEHFGAAPGTTPALAALADEGAALTSMYSTSNWTLPAHASLFAGLLPRALGLPGAASPSDVLSSQQDRLLPVVLNRRGYRTAAASANAWIVGHHGFDTGFDEFVEVAGSRPHRPDQGVRAHAKWAAEAVTARVDDGLARIDEVVRGWIRDAGGQPFFWFVNLMECHSPYLPPRPHNDLSPLGRLLAGEDARRFQTHDGFLAACTGALTVPPRSLRRMRHLYGRSIRMMDDWLARILEELERARLLDDTLVIVTSDHGENLGENGLMGHTLSLDDRLIRVPFVARGPGAPAATHEVTSLADVPGMIGRGLGLEGHPWADRTVPAGLAISQYDGVVVAADAHAKLMEAWNLTGEVADRIQSPMTCVTDGRHKLVRDANGTRLHDVHKDPLEVTDVTDAHPNVVTRLSEVLDRVDAGSHGTSQWETNADLEERLRLLGYM